MNNEHPVIFMSLSPHTLPPPPQGMKKVCMLCSATWLWRALTVPNWIHSLLHQLPLLIFVAFKMAFSKASVFWSSAWLIELDVWEHRCSLVISAARTNLFKVWTAETRCLDYAKFQPRSDRGIDFKRSYSIFQENLLPWSGLITLIKPLCFISCI